MTEILENEAVTVSYEASNLGTGQRIELIKTWAVQFSREELIVLLGMFSILFLQYNQLSHAVMVAFGCHILFLKIVV